MLQPVDGWGRGGRDPLIKRLITEETPYEWKHLASQLGKQLTSKQVELLKENGYIDISFPKNDAPSINVGAQMLEGFAEALQLNPEPPHNQQIGIYMVREKDGGIGVNMMFSNISEEKAAAFAEEFGITIMGIIPKDLRGRG